MNPATLRVVLDANVLFPFSLRDTFLRAASAGLFQVYWSADILDETTRNLKAKGLMTDEQAEHLIGEMARAFPEAWVTGYEPIIDSMPNDPKDRHVAAAAVEAGAEVIVTKNLSDFENLPDGIEAQGPDEFLLDLLDLEPDTLVDILHSQAKALSNPPRTYEELLVGLEKLVPTFVSEIRRFRA